VEIDRPEATMRKFLLNTSVLSAVFGAFGVVQTTRRGPRDWRLILMWIAWAISVAIAIGTVVEETRDAEDW
jgi:hypothetical protein